MSKGFSALIVIIGVVVISAIGILSVLMLKQPSPKTEPGPKNSSASASLKRPAPSNQTSKSTPQATPALTQDVTGGPVTLKIPSVWQATIKPVAQNGTMITVEPKKPTALHEQLFIEAVPKGSTTLQGLMAAYPEPMYSKVPTLIGNTQAITMVGTLGKSTSAVQETARFVETDTTLYFIRSTYTSPQPNSSVELLFSKIIASIQF